MSNKPTLSKKNKIAKFKKKQTGNGAAGKKQSDQAAHQPSLQVMVWYKEEDYPALLEIFDDAHRVPRNFADWHRRAEAIKEQVEAAGDQVMKVYIEPDTFQDWCENKGIAKDAEARSQLAIEVAQSRSFSL